MPADFDGKILPPAGAPNSFVEFPDSTGNNPIPTGPGITASECLSARARPSL